MVTRKLRVAAYAVCIDNGKILLARWIGEDGPLWTMPGGGLDHGEDPYDAVLREVEEETGYTVEIDRLLGIDSTRRTYPRPLGREEDFHGVRVLYRAHVVGGELRDEVGGSTDQAAWVDLDRVADLDRVPLVDIALAFDAQEPARGRIRSASA